MSVPTPDRITWEARELRQLIDELEAEYEAIYDAAYRPASGGSIGAIARGGSVSDGVRAAAGHPDKSMQRGKCRLLARKFGVALRALREARAAATDAWQNLPGGANRERYEREREARRERWRLVTWEDLPCGCTRSNEGHYVVSRECSEHMELVPLEDRVPFLDACEAGLIADGMFGPFKPADDEAASG